MKFILATFLAALTLTALPAHAGKNHAHKKHTCEERRKDCIEKYSANAIRCWEEVCDGDAPKVERDPNDKTAEDEMSAYEHDDEDQTK